MNRNLRTRSSRLSRISRPVRVLRLAFAAPFLALAAGAAQAQSGITDLGRLNGGIESGARGVSGDGSVVVGEATDGAAGDAFRAYRWTQAGA